MGQGGYVAEKAEGDTGWLFPVGDEVAELGYSDMFVDMFDAWDEGCEPMETLYDGYVVNAIIDACYRSAKTKQWETIEMDWRGEALKSEAASTESDAPDVTLKTERMPDGRLKRIVKGQSHRRDLRADRGKRDHRIQFPIAQIGHEGAQGSQIILCYSVKKIYLGLGNPSCKV